MTGKTVKLYELSMKEDNRHVSPYCWRARLACLHKGLKVETVPWRFTEKDRLKFANADAVPVLADGDKSVKDSFDIALYLEKTYPDGPSLFGGPGGEASCRLVNNLADVALFKYFAALLPDILSKFNKAEADYFRETREKAFGGTVEELSKGSDEKIKALRESLEPLRMTLGQQKFVGGDQPNYGDYCIASIFLTGKAVSKFELLEKDDPVLEWLNRILAKFQSSIDSAVWEG